MISAKGFGGRTVGSGTITVAICLGFSRSTSTSGVVTLGSFFGGVGVTGGGVGDVGSYIMGQKVTSYTG